MNKGFVALMLLTVLLLPMYAGLRRIRHLPRHRDEPSRTDRPDMPE